MSAITLYNPNYRTFSPYDPLASNNPLDRDILLLNILIELQVVTQHLAAMNQGVVTESPEQIRQGLVSN